MRKVFILFFLPLAYFLSTFVFRGLDANKNRPNTGQRLQNAFYWSTDKGVMYFRESPGQQWAISGIESYEWSFTETSGDGVYTATLAIPAGYSVQNILVGSTALWTAGTSALLRAGDADSATGYINDKSLKAAGDVPLDASGAWTYAASGAGGAYALGKYYAAAGLLTITITKVGTGTAGRTRVAALLRRGARTPAAVAKV